MITPRAAQTDAATLEQHVADHYDDLDKWYRVVWGEHVHHGLWRDGNESQPEAVQKLTTYLADKLEIKGGDRVCDVGCGYGGTARILASQYRAQVDGYTLSEKQYAFAQERLNGKSNPKYYLKNWFANDIEDASRDAAIGIESSEHFDDKPAMIQEMHRVLKPGGRIGLYTWLACPAPTDWQRKHLLEAICAEGRLPSLGDESDYRRWLEEAGFTEIQYENLTRQVRKTMPLIVLRIMRRLTWDLSGWRHLLFGPNKVFAKTIVRITWAYYSGAMEYGIFTARKP
jgi:tocopherol O-methyltransferase